MTRRGLASAVLAALAACGGRTDEPPAPVEAPRADARPAAPASGCGERALDCEGGACVGGRCAPVVLARGIAPGLLAEDDANLYVTDTKTPAVYRVAKRGGALEALARTEAPATGIAVSGGVVFFASARTVSRVPASGGAASPLATMPGGADALAVNGTSIYVLDAQGFGSVSAIDLATARVRSVSRVALSPRAIAATRERAYWAEASGRFFVEGPDEGTLLAADPTTMNLACLAIDGDALYFTDALERGRVGRLAARGGSVETVAALPYPAGLAAVSGELFVAELGNGDGRSGAIVRVSAATGAVTTLADGLGRPTYLVADATRVFFVDVDHGTVEKIVR